MNTKEMEQIVRDQLLEYTTNPIDSLYIARQLNGAYRFVYNHIIRSDPMRFGQFHPISVVGGTTEYDLPEQLWGKRFSMAIVPNPTNESTTPWRFREIPIVDYRRTLTYQTTRYRTAFPEVVSVLNNKLYIYPPSLHSFTMNLIVTRKIPMLGVYGGRVVGISGANITLDELFDDRIVDTVGDANLAFISICDGTTGEIKAVYYYTAASSTTKIITLATHPTRTTFLDAVLTAAPVSTYPFEIDDVVTFGYTSGMGILGDTYDDFLINWATMKIRGILNETDAQVVEALKLELQQLQGDQTGRERGMKIERTFGNFIGPRPTRR